MVRMWNITLSLVVSAILILPAVAADTPRELSQIAGWQGANPKSEEGFTFIVLSDRTGLNIAGMWEEAVNQTNLLQPDFVMCVGDLIEGYQNAEITHQQWDEAEFYIKKLDAPFFYCAGNHDITNDMQLEIYLKRHGVNGKSYYSFDYRGVHFIVLDSMNLQSGRPEEQIAWLEKDLAKAQNAKQVFVFYHHPLWSNPLWESIAKLLPAGKTTIFNGHTHRSGYHSADGITTYVLSATGAGTDKEEIKYFAQVSVDGDKSTVALIPTNAVIPVDYLPFSQAVQNILGEAMGQSALLGNEGGTYAFRAKNPLDKPITIKMTWKGKGWTFAPQTLEWTLEPGQEKSQSFSIFREGKIEARPEMEIRYTIDNPYRKETIEYQRTLTLGAGQEMTGAIGRKITLDGKLDDWAGVTPLLLDRKDLIFKSPYNWSGPEDHSINYYAATDGEYLYVAAEVTDDDVTPDADADPWFSDGIEFFWDTRPEETRTARRSPETGQVILSIPADGSNRPGQAWFMNGQPTPENFQAVYAPREGGYVLEISVPLKEIGLTEAIRPGQVIFLGLIANDRSAEKNTETCSRISACGMGNENNNTSGYIRCEFK